MIFSKHLSRYLAAISIFVLAGGISVIMEGSGTSESSRGPAESPVASPTTATAAPAPATVDLSQGQLNAISLQQIGSRTFTIEKEAAGTITFVDDRSVQVFPSYQGKLLNRSVELGDAVQKGQTLYSIDSPDLIQAESALIAAAAALDLTERELKRATELHAIKGVSDRELEQATSDEQTAEGAFKAAHDAVRVFGKSEKEIDEIVKTRSIDPALIVPSPINGEVTAITAPPGLLVQPGNAPAPVTVSDATVRWMIGYVMETESPMFKPGQAVRVRLPAYPQRVFSGKIDKIGSSVDPNTHRVMIRSEIADPKHELLPGMMASFSIQVSDPEQSLAIPVAGVVRNGDGQLTAWVTTDKRHFEQRLVKVGEQSNGFYQVLESLHADEWVVTDGAIFLNSIIEGSSGD